MNFHYSDSFIALFETFISKTCSYDSCRYLWLAFRYFSNCFRDVSGSCCHLSWRNSIWSPLIRRHSFSLLEALDRDKGYSKNKLWFACLFLVSVIRTYTIAIYSQLHFIHNTFFHLPLLMQEKYVCETISLERN